MSSPNESGNVNNANNFEELIAVCVEFGPPYNPGNPAITVSAMNGSLTATRAAMQTANVQEAVYDTSVDNREDAYAPLGETARRVMAAAKASPLTENQKEDIHHLVLKLTGRRSSTPVPDPANPGATISSSQMGYDQRAENLDKLIQLLALMPGYNPNEAELTVAGLTTLHATLVASNTDEATAKQPYATAITTRNELLYKSPNGLTYLAIAVKNYVKSLFGVSSPQYKRVAAIRFTKRRHYA